jgi:thiocyanate desulfurase
VVPGDVSRFIGERRPGSMCSSAFLAMTSHAGTQPDVSANGGVHISASKLSEAYGALGRYIYVTPTKMAGGVHAVDMSTGKTLAWIAYWNYGDTCAISHHLSAFPAADPYEGFEFINTTQGGKNLFMYGIPTPVKQPGEGFSIYRVRFDGRTMTLVEDVAETTGLGLGVHVTITPDAQAFAVADGQKDVIAFFDRATSKVLTALYFEREPNSKVLRESWIKGGTMTIKRIYPDPKTGKYDLKGLKGIEIDWEMPLGGELMVEEGVIPGSRPLSLVGADGVVHDPRGRWSSVVIRLLGMGLILNRTRNYEPVAALHTPRGAPDQFPVVQVDQDTWTVTMDQVVSPAHKAGFSPDGRRYCMMNNLRQHGMVVFDTAGPDPREWKKIAFVEDPTWRDTGANPFHLVFSVDGRKVYCSLLRPAPADSGVVVVDTESWKILKQIDDVGPDAQTLAVTYDGNYVFTIFSGFQRFSSGIFVIDARTDEPIGYLPSAGGHHDCVIVPRTNAELSNSRSTTL